MTLQARLPETSPTLPWPAIDTRFGMITYDPSKVITLPKGLLGFHDYQEFILIDPPQQAAQQLKVLQCVSHPEFALFVLPLAEGDAAIDGQDRIDACQRLGIAPADAAFILVVTIRHSGDGLTISANQRAPIIIDTDNMLAYQYVMQNDKYEIRHPLATA